MKQLGDLLYYETVEEMPEDLQDYIYEGSGGMMWFKHPLYIGRFPLVCAFPIDEVIAKKTAVANKLLEEGKKTGDFGKYIFYFERAFRLSGLLELVELGYYDAARWHGDKRLAVKFWRLASEVWTDCEYSESDSAWTELMLCDIPYQEAMTDSQDRRKVREMPADRPIKVYRGVQARDRDDAIEKAFGGWQWTLDRDVAVFFANRYLMAPDKPYVVTGWVNKVHLQAYLTGRNEEEVLINPEDDAVCDIEIEARFKNKKTA